MASLNSVIIQGRLTADPELRQTQSNTPVANFNIAVDRRGKNEEKKADFFTVVAWKQTAEFVSKYFAKGSPILLNGSLQNRSWTDNNGQKHTVTEIVASEVYFCGGKNSSQQVETANSANVPTSFATDETDDFLELSEADDRLPF